jgi:hypothetical protein
LDFCGGKLWVKQVKTFFQVEPPPFSKKDKISGFDVMVVRFLDRTHRTAHTVYRILLALTNTGI